MTNDDNEKEEKKILRQGSDKEDRRRSSALSKAAKKIQKIVLVGSTKCGKTSLAKRFLHDEFTEDYKPTVEDSFYVNYKYRGRYFHLEIIDMPSPFLFPVMRDLHVMAASVIMLIYEIDNDPSYSEAMNALKKIRELRETVPIVLVGTKQDLEIVIRNVEEYTSNMSDTEMDIKHILTSAKDDFCVKAAFELCLEEIMPSNEDSSTSNLSISESEGSRVGCCRTM